jgi:hypothetical protein
MAPIYNGCQPCSFRAPASHASIAQEFNSRFVYFSRKEIIDIRYGQRAHPEDTFHVHADPLSSRVRTYGTSAGGASKTSSEIIRSEGPPKHHYPSNGRATGLLCSKTVYFHPSFGKTVRHRTGKEGYKALYLTWPLLRVS